MGQPNIASLCPPKVVSDGELAMKKHIRPCKIRAEDDIRIETQCKAGNPNCGLKLGESLALGAIGVMPCAVCCVEPDFCRECMCILCGKTMRCGYGAYTSVRCFARLSGAEFCGHAAHLLCALECQLGGVVKPLGLDMEYMCRRCDQKTDLRGHVVRLLDSLRYTDCRFSIEKNLETALQIIKGTKDAGAKHLVYLIQTAIKMMCKGADIRDIFDLLNGTEAEILFKYKLEEPASKRQRVASSGQCGDRGSTAQKQKKSKQRSATQSCRLSIEDQETRESKAPSLAPVASADIDVGKLYTFVQDEKMRLGRQCRADPQCVLQYKTFYKRIEMEKHLLQHHNLHVHLPYGQTALPKGQPRFSGMSKYDAMREKIRFEDADRKYKKNKTKFGHLARCRGMDLWDRLPEIEKLQTNRDTWVKEFVEKKLRWYESTRARRMEKINKHIHDIVSSVADLSTAKKADQNGGVEMFHGMEKTSKKV